MYSSTCGYHDVLRHTIETSGWRLACGDGQAKRAQQPCMGSVEDRGSPDVAPRDGTPYVAVTWGASVSVDGLLRVARRPLSSLTVTSTVNLR